MIYSLNNNDRNQKHWFVFMNGISFDVIECLFIAERNGWIWLLKYAVLVIPFGNAAEVVLRFHSDLAHSNSRGFRLMGRQLPCAYPPPPPPPTIRPHPFPPTIRPYPPPTITPYPTPTPRPTPPPPDRCDVIFDAPEGQLQSPNYPNFYAPSLACQFRWDPHIKPFEPPIQSIITAIDSMGLIFRHSAHVGSSWPQMTARWNFPSRTLTWRTAEAATRTPSSSAVTDTAPIPSTTNEVGSIPSIHPQNSHQTWTIHQKFIPNPCQRWRESAGMNEWMNSMCVKSMLNPQGALRRVASSITHAIYGSPQQLN